MCADEKGVLCGMVGAVRLSTLARRCGRSRFNLRRRVSFAFGVASRVSFGRDGFAWCGKRGSHKEEMR